MKSINYFLIEASKLKVGGYYAVSRDFYEELIIAIYEGSSYSKAHSLLGKINWVKDPQSGVVMGHPFINYSIFPLIWERDYQASSSSSAFVINVYKKARLIDTYRELAFVMFILRLVNPKDYLAWETDLDYVVGRLKVTLPKRVRLEDGYLVITPGEYMRLMLLYIRNASDGVDYGVNAWDFVYHILNTRSVKGKDLLKISKSINSVLDGGLKLGDYNVLTLTESNIKKYTEEIVVMAPVLAKSGYLSRDEVIQLALQLADFGFNRNYLSFLLANPVIFEFTDISGVNYNCSWQ